MGNMITEDYVSFETAKLLKEKEFDEATNRYYNAQYDQIRTVSDTFMWHWNNEEFVKGVLMEGAIAIPTLQMAMKWLREKYSLEIYPYHNYDNSKWWYEIIKYPNSVAEYECDKDEELDTYEEACESAIKHCLENLILI